jgi:hypothetical protein
MKSGPMFDPQSARNQCKLIWDSASGPRNKLPVKKKVGFTSDSSVTVKESLTQSRVPRRNSLVATRISFYEERPEPQTDDEVIQMESDGNHTSEVQVVFKYCYIKVREVKSYLILILKLCHLGLFLFKSTVCCWSDLRGMNCSKFKAD